MPEELTIIVQDSKTVRARTGDGGEKSGEIKLDKLRRQTIHILETWLTQGKTTERGEIEVLGMHLYQVLFGGDIGKFFENSLSRVPQGERLRVQLSFQEAARELAAFPWEYLYYPDEEERGGFFFATHVDLVLSRYMPLEEGRKTLKPEAGTLRILIVVSQPSDQGPVMAGPVIEAIQKMEESYPIKVEILDKPTIDAFLDKLSEVKPHVLHFIGHGVYENDKGKIAFLETDETVIWVEDKEFSEYFINTRSIPRLVFLHLCEGGKLDFTANFAGLAPQLIRANVPAVVAMRHPISNKAAIAFSRAFYRELAAGQPVDNAVQVGRWRITTADPKQAYKNRVFGTPVLFMRSSDGIIQPAQGAEKPRL
jgi:hypothetical protein